MDILRSCGPALLAVSLLAGDLFSAEPAALTMTQAVEKALSVRPELQAAAARIVGAGGFRTQAGLRPNPEFEVESENWRFTGTPSFNAGNDLDVFAFIRQPFETGGKRDRRVVLAQQDVKIAELEKQALEWRIRQQVRQAYLRALMAQRQLELLQENGRNFEQIIEYHRVRVEQGAMPEADLIRVQLERERLSVSESEAAVEKERARVELLRTMGVSGEDDAFVLEDVRDPVAAGPKLDLEALRSLARSKRVEILLAQAMIDKEEANLGLQQSLAKPNWALLLGYKRTAGYDTILAGITVPLPFFDRNEGNIAGSKAEVTQAEAMLRAATAQVDADLSASLVVLRRRRAMLEQMEKGMVERAEESLRISLAAYQEGGSDLLRLLDAQRVRNEVQLMLARSRMEYRISLADLENAVGEENLPLAEELFRVLP